MLSDSEHKRRIKSGRSRSVEAVTNRQWSDKQKMEAIQSWLVLGNLAMVSRLLGIPEVTIRSWKAASWWNDAVNELRSQEKIVLSNKLKAIVNASLAVVEDRLSNGDYMFDQKTGQTIRKPVNMKDAHKVAVDLQDRQETLEKATQDTSVGSDESIEHKLVALADKFAELATKKLDQKVNEHRTIDVSDASIKEEE